MPKTFEQEQRRQTIRKLGTLIRFVDWINENVSSVTLNHKNVTDFLDQDIIECNIETETFIKNGMRKFENFDIEGKLKTT